MSSVQMDIEVENPLDEDDPYTNLANQNRIRIIFVEKISLLSISNWTEDILYKFSSVFAVLVQGGWGINNRYENTKIYQSKDF